MEKKGIYGLAFVVFLGLFIFNYNPPSTAEALIYGSSSATWVFSPMYLIAVIIFAIILFAESREE